MQLNLNSKYNQNFGMSLKIGDDAQRFLRSRKLSNKNIDKLADLAASQVKNPYDVFINYDNNIKSLRGKIYRGNRYYQYISDSFLNQLFGNPVKFIEKCCKNADEINAKYSKPHDPFN